MSIHPLGPNDYPFDAGTEDRSLGNVLAFGGHYIHCGQPMQKAGSELRRFSAPVFTDGALEDGLDIYMTTRVLRCPCGFQMELPE